MAKQHYSQAQDIAIHHPHQVDEAGIAHEAWVRMEESEPWYA